MRKIVSLLTILLLMLISNCYAMTKNEMKNAVYSWLTKRNMLTDSQTRINAINNFSYNIGNNENAGVFLENYFNNDRYKFFVFWSDNGAINVPNSLYVFVYDMQQTTNTPNNKLIWSDGNLWRNFKSTKAIYIGVSQGHLIGNLYHSSWSNDQTYNMHNGAQFCELTCYYTNGSSIAYQSNYLYNMTIDTPFVDEVDYFGVVPYSNQTRSVDVNGRSTNLYYYPLLPIDNGIAYLNVPEDFKKITLRVSYYNTTTRQFENLKLYTLFDKENQTLGDLYEIFNEDNLFDYAFMVERIQDYTIGDTICDFTFYRDVEEYTEDDIIDLNCYIGSDNTIMSTSSIDINATFSGDYINEYNQNLQNFLNDQNNNYNEQEKQEQLNSNFENVIKAIESGERQEENRFNWWKEQYNNLLAINQEEISGELNQLMNDLDLGSGEKEIALAGLDILDNNEWGDFIISWGAYSPTLTIKNEQVPIKTNGKVIKTENQDLIPSSQINFSQIERENETFKEVMKYARAFISFIVICAFMKNVWNTLLITLGISTQVYEKEQEAESLQAYQEEKWKSQKDKQNYQEWLRRHKK